MFKNYLKVALRNLKRYRIYSLINIACLVIVANLMAWPVAYYAMNRWLQGFAYRIDLRLWIFPVTALITVAITLATVCYKALKAARANPVEALRYE